MENRVYLRPLTEDDINNNYLEGFANDDVTSFLEVDGKNLTKEMVISYINAGHESKKYFMYAVCLKENNKQVGNLKVGPIDYKHMLSDLVTVIWDREQWGKGLATDAIKQGNKIAFELHNIRKLTGGIYESNIGSIKAYTRAGWIVEGRLFNHYIVNGKYEDRVLVSCFNPYYDSKSKF
jgi:ribosomal-protein-alanine N-acetyltransferase